MLVCGSFPHTGRATDATDVPQDAASTPCAYAQKSTVSDIVNGTTYNAGVATIKKLCDGLEITVRQFFDSDLFDDLEQEVH